MINYGNIVPAYNIQTIEELYKFFWDEVTPVWTEEYTEAFPKHGEITLQNFQGFAFVIDHVWSHVEEADSNNELPKTRVVSFFGISNTNINKINRSRMRTGWGKSSIAFSEFGTDYDKGHFMAHGFGGPIDVNLFPQRRDINRGWSDEGKRFRKMESYIAANPGTLVFSRPLYKDFSVCPFELEYGYFDKELKLNIETFPNR